MQIRIEPHTLKRAMERGATEEEVNVVLNEGETINAKAGRSAKAKVFEFNALRNGKHYPQKRVEVYFIIEGDTIITITVYVYYGEWED